jgi:hypothetical protein
MARLPALLGIVCLLSATACSMAADPVRPSRGPVPVPAQERAAASPAPVAGEVPAELLDKIRADLAGRHGLTASAIQVVTAEAVNWPNGALGCAKPGEMVTQAIVPGYRVLLEAGGKQYAYHAAQRGFFRLCENEVNSGLDRSSIK